MTIRKLLIRVPVLGPIVERRWIPHPAERAQHRELVRGRRSGAIAPSDRPPDPTETPELPAG